MILWFTPVVLLYDGITKVVHAQADEIKIINDNGITYVVHIHTTTGSTTFTPPAGVAEIDVLVVGGGGGGGGGSAGDTANSGGGGGGAGGLIFRPGLFVGSLSLPVDVTVGDGGAPRENGIASQFAHLTALGGGAGGGNTIVAGRAGAPGGSGGGGGHNLGVAWSGGVGQQPDQPGESGDFGFGNAGGSKVASPGVPAAGGGGAGEPGTEGGTNASTAAGGDGLHQVEIGSVTYNFASIFGTGYGELIDGEVWFAGGGGGDRWNSTPPDWTGVGGKGGGGNGADYSGTGTPGMPNTGGGGGGADGRQTAGSQNGTDGGSGIVMVRYNASSIAAGATTLNAEKISLETDLTIDTGVFITFEANILDHNSNTILVQSGGLFNNQTGTPVGIRAQRELLGFDGGISEGGEGWRFISSPVDVQLSALLAPVWTQGITDNPGSGNTSEGTPNVYRWSTAQDGKDRAHWQPVTDLDMTAGAGEGFLVFVYAADFGESNPGNNLMLDITGSEFGSFSATTNEHEGDDGWTLLGNPYATSVSFENVRSSASAGDIADAVYVWAPNDDSGDGGQDPENPGGSWFTWSGGSGGDLTDGLIAPFQAFFVENADGESSVELTFNNSVKTTDTPQYLFKEQAPRDVIRMELAGQGMRNSAWLSFSQDGSTDERISGDAWQLTPISANYALLASQKPGIGLMDIGHFPRSGELSIPLVIKATRPGSYTLRVTDMDLNGLDLYLNDLQTGESVPLTEGMEVEFSIDQSAKAPADPFSILSNGPLKASADSPVRFIVSNVPAEDGAAEVPRYVYLAKNYPNPFNPATQIRFELPQQENVRLTVYDMTGRQVATLVNESVQAGVHTVTFDAGNLASGVYMYRLQAGSVIVSRQLTLIK